MVTHETVLDHALEELVYGLAEPPDRVALHRRVTLILADIVDERRRQEAIGERKRAEGIAWRSCADPAMAGGDFARSAVLGEEVGEVHHAVLEATYGSETLPVVLHWERELRRELVQVAAVAVAWIEAIDVRSPRGM